MDGYVVLCDCDGGPQAREIAYIDDDRQNGGRIRVEPNPYEFETRQYGVGTLVTPTRRGDRRTPLRLHCGGTAVGTFARSRTRRWATSSTSLLRCGHASGCADRRVRIEPAYIGLGPLPASSTVVYKVNGGDDAKIGNFTIDSDGIARFDETDNISGPQGAVLTATVTQVIVR